LIRIEPKNNRGSISNQIPNRESKYLESLISTSKDGKPRPPQKLAEGKYLINQANNLSGKNEIEPKKSRQNVYETNASNDNSNTNQITETVTIARNSTNSNYEVELSI
jgi:hypothetical protein